MRRIAVLYIILFGVVGLSLFGIGITEGATIVVPDTSFTTYQDIQIYVDSLPNGLAGYQATLTVSDPTKFEIVSVTHPSWAVIHSTTGTLPGSSVNIYGADTGSVIQAGATNTEIVTVKLNALTTGSGNLEMSVTSMDNDIGGAVSPSVDNGAMTVTEMQGLHFSGAVTIVPTTVGQYYEEIEDSDLSWVDDIAPVIPKPLVDTFGGGDFGFQLLWFWVIGALFIIMFGRQRNVVLPGLMFLVSSWFFINGGLGWDSSTGWKIPEDMTQLLYGIIIAAFAGVIYFIGRRKR